MEESVREIKQSKTMIQPHEKIDVLLNQQQEQLITLSRIADLLKKAQDATLQRKWIVANAGETSPLPFDGVKSLYVDNTHNPVAMRIRLDGEPGLHLIPAFCASYIPCDGARTINAEGSGFCHILCSNIPVPPTSVNANSIVTFSAPQPVTLDEPIETSIVGSLAKLSTEEFPAVVEGYTLIEFYPNPDDNKYYRGYLGEWREV